MFAESFENKGFTTLSKDKDLLVSLNKSIPHTLKLNNEKQAICTKKTGNPLRSVVSLPFNEMHEW